MVSFVFKMVLFGIIVALLSLHGSLAAVTYVIPPFNTTAGVGGNASIACIVSGKTAQESVKWKRFGQTNVLTLDAGSVGDARYQVQGTYNLTIAQITKADEGGYTCEAGTLTKTAYLTVVEFPTNVSVYWSTPPIAGTTANLTCKATHSNPAPSFLWYKDEILYNTNAVYYTNPSSPGYVDAYSVLPVQLSVNDQSSRFRCQLEYTGLSRAMEATIVTKLSSGATTQTKNSILVVFGTIFVFLVWH